MGDIETNKRQTLDLIKAIERGDADYIAGAYAEDGRLHTMGHTLISGVYGPEQIRQFAGAMLEAFPRGLSYTIHHLTAEEDRVAVEARRASCRPDLGSASETCVQHRHRGLRPLRRLCQSHRMY